MTKQFVVILELDTGYMDCLAVCDNAEQAYGEAYLALVDGLDPKDYYISLPEPREGDNGFMIETVEKKTGEIYQTVTVLIREIEQEET